MDAAIIGTTKALGDAVGESAQAHDDKSLLYTLRSCRNQSDLLSFFEQMLTRYIGESSNLRQLEALIAKIDALNWRDYKSLISIFAALKYSSLEVQKKGNDPRETQSVIAA